MSGWLITRCGLGLAVLLSALLVTPGVSMAQTLDEPAVVALDFLDAIKQDVAWLEEELAPRGLRGRYRIEDGRLVTDDLDVLRYVNRIRAFAYLDRPRTFPYFSLTLADAGGNSVRCVTLYPRDFVPDLGVLGFRQEEFGVADADSDVYAPCRVTDSAYAEFADIERAEFRQEFFGRSGELDINRYARLSEDPSFVARAIDLGYYAFRSQFAGYLQIGLDEAR